MNKPLLTACLLIVLAGCSKSDKPALDKNGLPPPMPGAVPMKVVPLAPPDPIKLQKAIEEQQAKQKDEAASAPADTASAPSTSTVPAAKPKKH